MKELARAILRALARLVLRRYKPLVVGVAGSVGKTATKDAIAAVLEKHGRHVRKTVGSFNAEVGVPVTIIAGGAAPTHIFGWLGVIVTGLRRVLVKSSYPSVLVIEMGSDKPGDLGQLLEIVTPRFGVLTSLAPEHLEFFGDEAGVVAEETLIVRNLGADGRAIINGDDARIQEAMKGIAVDHISYGWDESNDVRAVAWSPVYDESHLPTGMIIKISVDGNIVPIALPGVIGRHQAYPVLAALATAKAHGDRLVEIIPNLAAYRPPVGRMRLLRGREGALVIDDSYNSSPEAAQAALETLFSLDVPGKKYVILGQMSELGAKSNYWHDAIGRMLQPKSVAQIVTVGPLAQRFGQAAIEVGFPSAHVINVADAEAAAAQILPRLGPGDVILLKGSRYAARLERAVRMLLADPRRDEKFIVEGP